VTVAPTTAADPEAAYYQTIEEHFVSLRGDPLFLSNADWLLIHKWRQAGTPLRVVLRGITDAIDAHAHSWSRDRKVGSLAYCAAEVDAARERWQRALSLEEEEGTRAEDVLPRFAQALEDAATLGAASRAVAVPLAAELRRRAGHPGALGSLEPWLAEGERALLAAVRLDAGAPAVAELEKGVDAELAPYRTRMPARILAQIRRESISRRLLERHGLPRLSLFHL
jgi:hypothetical protein